MATWLNPLVNMPTASRVDRERRAARVTRGHAIVCAMADLDAARDLIDFIDASPSPFHACATAAARLDAAGFTRLDETDAWTGPTTRAYVVRDGSLVAWATPSSALPTTPFRIIGAHTDSPNLRLKPNADT